MQEWVAVTAFGISLVGLLVASYSDIKERIVDDKISYGMIGTGLLLFFGNALLYADWQSLVWSVAAGIGTFVLGYLLWRIGFWAGGDVKLFTGLAVLNPINWVMIAKGLQYVPPGFSFEFPVFPLTLFLASVLALLPIGILLLAGKALKEPEKFRAVFSNPKERLLSIVFSALVLSAISFWLEGNMGLLAQIGVPSLALVLGLIIGMGWIEKKTKRLHAAKLLLCLVILVTGFWFWSLSFVANAVLLAIVLAVLAFLFSLFFSNKLFRSVKAVDKLREGDISAVTIVETEKGVEIRSEPGWREIIKNLKNPQLIVRQKKEREICSSRRAGGLEKEQIEEIRRLAGEGRIPKTLEVKESAAFVPAVLAAYLALNALGDPWRLLL